MQSHLTWLAAISGLLLLAHTNSYAFSCADITGVPQIECEALVALYNNTNGDEWHIKSNWQTNQPVASWQGVTVYEGHVIEIDLAEQNLIGKIPAELGNLVHLEKLELQDNQLSQIPPTLGQLINLQRLDLSNNILSTIPNELSNLTQLQRLYLHENRLSGTIPTALSKLSNLISLSLSDNQFSGTIPIEFKHLTNLQALYIHNNYLHGDTPSTELAPLLNGLRFLNVYNNCLNPTDTTIRNIFDSKDTGYWIIKPLLFIVLEYEYIPWDAAQNNCLAPASCQLYAVHDAGLNNAQFFTLKLADLSTESLGYLYEGYDIEAFAIHPSNNNLYAVSGDAAPEAGYLYQIDGERGNHLPIGATGFIDIQDLTFSPDGTLYAWANGQGIITIDVNTGQGTLVAPSDLPVKSLTLSKHAATTLFYAVINQELWQFNLSTGALEMLCNDLPTDSEALEMLNDDELLIGTHEVTLGMYIVNLQTCEFIMADNTFSNPFKHVEALALPVAACN